MLKKIDKKAIDSACIYKRLIMTMIKKRESTFDWMLFVIIMMVKICSIVTLCAIQHEHHELPHSFHPSQIKDKRIVIHKPRN